VEAMSHELRELGQTTNSPLHTIYFGGGTPSLLSVAQVRHILEACCSAFAAQENAEITLESNPGSLEPGYLEGLRAAGVNRLSFGMQSAHSAELQLFARQHDFAAVGEAMQQARRAGFENVSLDLIYGVPHQTLEGWRYSVEAALALQPDHLSMYALIVEQGTPMARWIEGGSLPTPDDDLAADMYDLGHALAEQAGLLQYEISNWARPGAECRHNLQYWRNLPYLGVGAGAHGYAAGLRYEVVRPIPRYLELAMAPHAPLPFPLTPTVEHSEPVDASGAMVEHMMTGLRLVREGVSLEGFRQRFGLSLSSAYGEALDQLHRHDLLIQEGDSLRLTPRARLLSNQVFLAFM